MKNVKKSSASQPAMAIRRERGRTEVDIAPVRRKKKIAAVVGADQVVRVDRETLAQLVAETLEKKRKSEGKRKQYVSRSSEIIRVPNELVKKVKAMIAEYRKTRREDPDRYI